MPYHLPDTVPVYSVDGAHQTIGATTDVEATADGTLVGILKRIRTLLSGEGGTSGTFPIRIKNGDLAYEANVAQMGAFDSVSYAWQALAVFPYTLGYVGGNVWDRVRIGRVHKNLARTAFTANVAQTVWTPTSGTAPRLLSFSVTTSGAAALTVKIGTQVVWERDFAAAGGADVDIPNGWIGNPNDLVTLTASTAVTAGMSAHGCEE